MAAAQGMPWYCAIRKDRKGRGRGRKEGRKEEGKKERSKERK